MWFCDGEYYGDLELKVVSHFLGTLVTSFSLFCKNREVYETFVYRKEIRYQVHYKVFHLMFHDEYKLQ